MVPQWSVLGALIDLIDAIPSPPGRGPGGPRGGRPPGYSDRLFVKALGIMLVRNLTTVSGLLGILEQPTWEMRTLRTRLTEHGRFPSRRTWERRLVTLPDTLPARIGCLGRHLVGLIDPWAGGGCAVAIDSTMLHARGGLWHKKHRDAGVVAHTSIDTEVGWTRSGWHGWVYGRKLHLVKPCRSLDPLAAELTTTNTADNEPSPRLLDQLPRDARFVLGGTHYNDPIVRDHCFGTGRFLVATGRRAYPIPTLARGPPRLPHV